jgi:Fic family protein
MAGDGMQMMTQSLITRIAIAHAHFEAVHPFRDGNGRVGRLLIPMMLAAEKEPPLYLSSYIEAYKQDYYDALKQAQQKLNWLPLIAFMSQAIIGTVQEFKTVRKATETLKTEWLSRRSYRKNSAALRALDILIDCPVITAARLGKALGISAPATKTALEQLQDAGILVERTGYARNRIFSAPEVMAIINRPFALITSENRTPS